MATQIFPTRPQLVDRRRFLLSATAMATVTSTGVAASVEQRAFASQEEMLVGLSFAVACFI